MSKADKTIHLTYFAILKDQIGISGETVNTQAQTAEELYGEIRSKHGLPLRVQNLKVSINENFYPWDTKINDNDHVVFIPPVAGG